jgi:signal peptidase II
VDRAGTGVARPGASKRSILFGIGGGVVFLDVATKWLVQRELSLHEQIEVIGDVIRLTFIYNPGAAFGFYLGPYSRGIFLALSLLALAILFGMYAFTPATHGGRLASIALIIAGAFGNLIDRIRSPRGVIDFVDVGLGSARWPVFNVADMAVTTGALLLALSLWRDDASGERVKQPTGGGD